MRKDYITMEIQKKHCVLLVIVILMVFSFNTVMANVGGVAQTGNNTFNSWSSTGNPANDMAACALAQIGRSKSSLGYGGNWCAAFVVDCAYLTGQSEAIPFISGQTHDVEPLKQQILNRGGIIIDTSQIQAGDILFWNGHTAIAVDNIHSVHGNTGETVNYLCSFGYPCDNEKTPGFSGGSFQMAIRPNYKNPKGTLDVNGLLDGINSGATGIESEAIYGTFDVYINGSKVADDQWDWTKEYPAGTTYEISDIKARDGFSYDGSVSNNISGTITSGKTTDVRLIFNSCKLVVNGYLDKQLKDTLGSYGTFDVVINGFTVCDDCNSFNQRETKGSTYQITDIKAKNGYEYERVYSGSLSGTISSGTKTVRLAFNKIGELSCDWIEVDTLPGNVTTTNCEIQYNNHYEKKATNSPGSGYVQQTGSAIVEYENSGNAYESPIKLATSPSTRKELGYYYYHFCGASTGVQADHTIRGGYVHYDSISDSNSVVVVSGYPHQDDTDPDYEYYKLNWKTGGEAKCKSGVTCDGSNGSHGERSYYWYRMYTYQDLKAVTYYTWVKDSGWTSSLDSSATSVTIRYRLKSGSTCPRGLVLPTGLKEIQSSAFEGSTAITQVTIPNGVTTIGSRAFANCTNLTLVNIPSSVTSIGANAFLNDSKVVLNCQSNNVCVSYAQQYGITYRVQ